MGVQIQLAVQHLCTRAPHESEGSVHMLKLGVYWRALFQTSLMTATDDLQVSPGYIWPFVWSSAPSVLTQGTEAQKLCKYYLVLFSII